MYTKLKKCIKKFKKFHVNILQAYKLVYNWLRVFIKLVLGPILWIIDTRDEFLLTWRANLIFSQNLLGKKKLTRFKLVWIKLMMSLLKWLTWLFLNPLTTLGASKSALSWIICLGSYLKWWKSGLKLVVELTHGTN